ncbi:MAG TPA: MarR family winged helix-turn-helix transcriptional regulator [Xanthobacteraceae bacterium]|nr:MarR family winged helix-turn-helix transcriptional regulator [Xanthobacteraceae bacterium]
MTQKVLDLDRYIPALLTFLANKLSNGSSSIYRRLFGVSVTEWRVLSMLAVESNIPAQRVCQVIGFDKAIVSRTVQVLADKGWVSVATDRKDIRRRTLALTRAGKAMHDKILKVALKRESLLISQFSPQELDLLIDFLGRMLAKVGEVNAYDPSRPAGKAAAKGKGGAKQAKGAPAKTVAQSTVKAVKPRAKAVARPAKRSSSAAD